MGPCGKVGRMRICKGCGPTAADFPQGRNYCQPCYKASKKAWRQKRLAAGACKGCYRIIEVSSKGYCERCLEDRARQQEKVRQLSAWTTGLKEGLRCTDCDQAFESSFLHWDNLPGFEKIANISDMPWKGFSKEAILQEVNKCELVCATCHAKRGMERDQIKPHGKTL